MMIDLSKIGLSKIIEQATLDAYNLLSRGASSIRADVKYYLQMGVENYVRREYDNVIKIKTLVNPDKESLITDVYVEPFLRYGSDDDVVSSNDFIDIVQKNDWR